nr:MAG: putative RNA-dependent RNA polymerase [Guangxi cysto-like virus 13]
MTRGSEVPVFRPGDRLCDLLFSGARASRAQNKKYREGPIEVRRGIFSTDLQFLRFKDELSRELTNRFPRTVDGLGRVSGNGVRSNWYGVRHVNGFPMTPATYPLVDNTHLREKSGLANDFVEPWHREVFDALIELFFEDLEPVAVRSRNGSSSMMPFFTTDTKEKLALMDHSITNAESACALLVQGDPETAWRNFFVGGAYQTVYRRQSSDAVNLENGVWKSKDRPVADLEYALTGGRGGTFLPADKTADNIEVDGTTIRVPDGFFRERNRTAKGGPLGTNSILMVVAQACRKKLYSDFGYTLHHTTRSAMATDLREFEFTIAADVSNHDWFWGTFMLERAAKVLRDMGYAEWFCDLYLKKGMMADYVTDVSPTEGNILLGDWRKMDHKSGLHSGNAFTDIEGTYGMCFVYFLIQVEHTMPELIPLLQTKTSAKQVLRKYLRGELGIRLKDKSDDALLGWADRNLVPAARALQDKMARGEQVSPYMLVTFEDGFAFLGNLLLYPEHGDDTGHGITLTGNIVSMVINEFSPEYGVQSTIRDRSRVKRPFPGLAWGSMFEAYGTAPIYQEVRDLIEHLWFKHYGESYNVLRQKEYESDLQALRIFSRRFDSVGIPDLSEIDKAVLASPDKLQYMYTEEDVNPEVVKMLFKGIPLERVEPVFRKIIGDVNVHN